MPCGQSEGANVTQQPKPCEHQRDKENQRTFPAGRLKCSMVTLGEITEQILCPSENQRRVSCCHFRPSFPGGREVGVWQPELECKGLLQSWPQRLHFSPNCEQAVSRSPYLPWILDSSHWQGMSQPETSSPEETHSTPRIVPSSRSREIEQLGLGKCIRCMAHPGQCAHQAPGCQSCLDLGKAQNAQHTWVWALRRPPSSWYQNQTKTTKKKTIDQYYWWT